MNCSDVDELLAAYALDAVDDDERAAIEAHLAGCVRHNGGPELIATAAGFAMLAEEREPSAHLEERLLASAGTSAAAREPRRARVDLRDRRWPAAVAAAVIFAAVGFGAGVLLTSGGGEQSVVQVVQSEGAWMRAEAVEGQSTVRVVLAGLPPLPEEERYQVWAVRDARWLTVGICNTDTEGWWDGHFDFAMEAEDALAVTIEPAEGSERPSGELVLQAQTADRPVE